MLLLKYDTPWYSVYLLLKIRTLKEKDHIGIKPGEFYQGFKSLKEMNSEISVRLSMAFSSNAIPAG